MTHLRCPRCHLAVKCRADYLILTNCPRCLARAAIVSPLVTVPDRRVAGQPEPTPGARRQTGARPA